MLDLEPRFADRPRATQVLRPAAVALLAFAALSGCSGTTTTSPSYAVLSLTAAPNPVTAQASTVSGYVWNGSFNVTVTETAGVALTVSSISASLKEASNGIPVTGGGTVESQVNVSAASASIDARGSTDIGFNVNYTLPSAGRQAVVDVNVNGIDDNNVAISGTVRVVVN